MSTQTSCPTLKAHAFLSQHKPYFFSDAHFHVEAAAKISARELVHNLFQFEDGSVLIIDSARAFVAAYDSEEHARKALAAKRVATD